MKAVAVIGACFGDEGKGLMTDFFAHRFLQKETCNVVRFNGGAQAGHTVETRGGQRHVFHSIGAGTLAGAGTYLSKNFIVNPFVLVKELDEMWMPPIIAVHPECAVTTPYHMLVNQEIELSRGTTHRHGSCGLGINETMQSGPIVKVKDLDSKDLHAILKSVRYTYLEERMKQLELQGSELFWKRANSADILYKFRRDCEYMKIMLPTIANPQHAKSYVFEGAQGLLLDQDHSFFPHVTHSKTGITNVLPMLESENIEQLEIVYVMRSYMTRHGNGPFPSEIQTLKYEDKTNAPNDWQGTLRFGTLDCKLISDAIKWDLAQTKVSSCDISVSLAVTHLDQNDSLTIPNMIAKETGVPIRYTAYGPTRLHVYEKQL